MSLLNPTPKRRAVRFTLWGLGMILSSSLVGFCSGSSLRAELVACGWIPLLVPVALMPLKPRTKG